MSCTLSIGIRREDKNVWERRVPLAPEQVAELIQRCGYRFSVQPSPTRAFPDTAYAEAGATLTDDLSTCDLVLAVKEIPQRLFRQHGAYLYFSHTIKGQAYNMAMLQRLIDLEATLLDYECITNDQGRRTVFFGNYAGLAGMIDTLWTLGQRLAGEGHPTPLARIQPAHAYPSLEAAKAAIAQVGQDLAHAPLPASLGPCVVAFLGYGNVSRGAQEIFDLLPHRCVDPSALASLFASPEAESQLIKVVYKERDLVTPIAADAPFELQEYFEHPQRYQSRFAEDLPYLSVIVNGVFWNPSYPRFVTLADLDKAHAAGVLRLKVVGDITCDIGGSIECTHKCTTPEEPVFTYRPATGDAQDGILPSGINVMAVDNLPCELPVEASRTFGAMLMPYLESLQSHCQPGQVDTAGLHPDLARALIVDGGKLTPGFAYLQQHLDAHGAAR